MIRTSASHPLRIALLPIGKGAVGVTFAPGKVQSQAMTGAWKRDLDADLKSIRDWGATALISLIEPVEFTELQIEQLPERARVHGLIWHGLPITDGFAPDERFLAPWADLGVALVSEITAGDRVVMHCKGGLGRAGTVAAMLLLQAGALSSSKASIDAVRAVRPGAVETVEQEQFLARWASRFHATDA